MDCGFVPRPTNIRERFSCILLWGEVEPMMLLYAAMNMAIGLWLISPWWDTFSTVTASYKVLASIASEWVWGLWLVILACWLFWCIGAHIRSKMRSLTVFAVACTWFIIAASFGWNNLSTIGVPLFTFLGIGAAWMFLRVRLDHVNG